MKIKYISIYTVITYVLCIYLPWWILAIVGIFIGFYAKNLKSGIYESTISLSLAWAIKLIGNFFIQDYIIIDKIKIFMNLNSFQLILLTLMVPIIIGFVSSMFGYKLKEVIKSEG